MVGGGLGARHVLVADHDGLPPPAIGACLSCPPQGSGRRIQGARPGSLLAAPELTSESGRPRHPDFGASPTQLKSHPPVGRNPHRAFAECGRAQSEPAAFEAILLKRIEPDLTNNTSTAEVTGSRLMRAGWPLRRPAPQYQRQMASVRDFLPSW